MLVHHQTEEILEALSRHQVVFFIGARGTGKTTLVDRLKGSYEETGVKTVRVDAFEVGTPADLNDPISAAIGCSSDALTATAMPLNARVRVLVDNCERLSDRTWFPRLQDQWRALLSEEEARGRIAFLLLGRPLFRAISEGRGSPLLNIGVVKTARPLDAAQTITAFGVEEETARAVLRKTGGHPYLTSALARALDGDREKFAHIIKPFAAENRRYIMRLIEDHAVAARGVLADLLEAQSPISEAALIGTHFGEAHHLLGEECLDDLSGSGLIRREAGLCLISAGLLRSIKDIQNFLRAPEIELEVEPTAAYSAAAVTLFRAENVFRKRLATELAALDQAWWPSRIPAGLVAEAELRRRIEMDSSVPPDGEPHPILFLSMGELVDAMLKAENWDQVFRVRLGLSRAEFEEAARDLMAVRNKVAHNRVVHESDLSVLSGALRRLGLAAGD